MIFAVPMWGSEVAKSKTEIHRTYMVYVYIRFEYVSEQEEQEDPSEDSSENLGLKLFFITGNPFFWGQLAWNQFSEPFWGSKVAEEPLPTSFKKKIGQEMVCSLPSTRQD